MNHAFHSGVVRSAGESLTSALKSSNFGVSGSGKGPVMVSTLTGKEERRESYDASYWGRQVSERVKFHAATQRALEQGAEVFIEIGPHPVLGASVSETLSASGKRGHVVASLRRNQEQTSSLQTAVCEVYESGCTVNFAQVYEVPSRVAELPTYAWEHQRYWLEGAATPYSKWLYEVSWREAPLGEKASAKGKWLILRDEGGVGASLSARLTSSGHQVIEVRRGTSFSRLSESSYTISPGDAEQMKQLVTQALGRDGCLGVVHLWSLDEASEATLSTLTASPRAWRRERQLCSLCLRRVGARLHAYRW